MKRAVAKVVLMFAILFLLANCASFPHYRQVTDGTDRKTYLVAGRITDSFQKPIANCAIFLTRVKYSKTEQIFDTIRVATSDAAGNYSFNFELADTADFWLYFDAKDTQLEARYVYITHLFESTMFQYTGNNPVIVNIVMTTPGNVQRRPLKTAKPDAVDTPQDDTQKKAQP